MERQRLRLQALDQFQSHALVHLLEDPDAVILERITAREYRADQHPCRDQGGPYQRSPGVIGQRFNIHIDIRIQTPDGDRHRTDRISGHYAGRRKTEHDEQEKERVE